MAEEKTRAAAGLTALGLACGGFAINDGAASAAPIAPAVAASDSGAVQTSAYKLVFKDNFSGKKLSSAWSYRTNQPASRACSKPVARMVSLKNGKLQLQVRKDASKKPNKTKKCPDGQYLNAMISTEKSMSFQYGKFSARIKFHNQKGAHGSFWLQSPRSEVDTIEYFGTKNPGGGLRSYVHRPKPGNDKVLDSSGGQIKSRTVKKIIGKNAYAHDAFHTYTVEWTPTSYVFSIDGHRTLKVTRNISSQPVFLVLSLLSSYYELPNLKHDKLPLTMKVDWVKVWRK
jgi:beta-glucanase (GH16 family)